MFGKAAADLMKSFVAMFPTSPPSLSSDESIGNENYFLDYSSNTLAIPPMRLYALHTSLSAKFKHQCGNVLLASDVGILVEPFGPSDDPRGYTTALGVMATGNMRTVIVVYAGSGKSAQKEDLAGRFFSALAKGSCAIPQSLLPRFLFVAEEDWSAAAHHVLHEVYACLPDVRRQRELSFFPLRLYVAFTNKSTKELIAVVLEGAANSGDSIIHAAMPTEVCENITTITDWGRLNRRNDKDETITGPFMPGARIAFRVSNGAQARRVLPRSVMGATSHMPKAVMFALVRLRTTAQQFLPDHTKQHPPATVIGYGGVIGNITVLAISPPEQQEDGWSSTVALSFPTGAPSLTIIHNKPTVYGHRPYMIISFVSCTFPLVAEVVDVWERLSIHEACVHTMKSAADASKCAAAVTPLLTAYLDDTAPLCDFVSKQVNMNGQYFISNNRASELVQPLKDLKFFKSPMDCSIFEWLVKLVTQEDPAQRHADPQSSTLGRSFLRHIVFPLVIRQMRKAAIPPCCGGSSVTIVDLLPRICSVSPEAMDALTDEFFADAGEAVMLECIKSRLKRLSCLILRRRPAGMKLSSKTIETLNASKGFRTPGWFLYSLLSSPISESISTPCTAKISDPQCQEALLRWQLAAQPVLPHRIINKSFKTLALVSLVHVYRLLHVLPLVFDADIVRFILDFVVSECA